MNNGNLRPPRTKSEARERGSNGGIASGKARRAKKLVATTYAERRNNNLTPNGYLFHGTLDTSLSGVWVIGKETNHPSPEGLDCLPLTEQPITLPARVKSLSRHKTPSAPTVNKKRPHSFRMRSKKKNLSFTHCVQLRFHLAER